MVTRNPRSGTTADTGFLVEGAGFRREGRTILDRIDLRLSRGEIVGIIGPNGAGKSSLMKLLSGHHAPDQGRIELNGRPVGDWPARDFAREVGYLAQSPGTGANHTVAELVALGRYAWHGPLGRKTQTDREATRQAMEDVGCLHQAGRLVSGLSGGERQRVWIAMALAQARSFLLLDEPTSALDLAQQAKLMTMLRGVVGRRRVGVAMIVHDLNLAAQSCDRILALRRGAAVACDVPDRVMVPDVLSRIYDIPMQVFRHPVNGRPVGYVA